jgi:uncharacterized protein YegJ (DUF2314 family)
MPGLPALALLVVLVGATASAQGPGVTMVPENDPEMAAAIAKGRATLGQFWQALEKPAPNEQSFALKVALPLGNGRAEHIWANNVERRDGKIFGTINNEPKDLKNVRLGQRIEVSDVLISDWMYMRSGKIVGGYTIRALLKHMPPDRAAHLRAMLADP